MSVTRLLLANALILLVGYGLFPRRPGVAYVAGLAVVGALASTFALVGLAVGWIWLSVFAALSLAMGGRRIRRPERRAWTHTELAVTFVGAAAGVALLVRAGRAFAVRPLVEWDGWAIWGAKAHDLYVLGWADPALFAQRPYGVAHRDYPLLLPSLEAIDFRAIGHFDPRLVHLQLLLFAVALVAALWSLLGDRVSPFVLVPTLLAVLAAPAVLRQLLTGYADVPLAVFFAVGVAAGARWLLTDERWPLALAALCFGAATLTKSEGQLEVGAAFLALLLATRASRWRPLAAAALASALMLLPWRIYAAVHHVGTEDYRLADAFHPGYVAGRLGRGRIGGDALLHSAFTPSIWSLLAPLFLVACVLALRARRPQLVAYAWIWILLSLAGLVLIYVISPAGIGDYVNSTRDRIVAPLVLAAAALAPLLAAGESG